MNRRELMMGGLAAAWPAGAQAQRRLRPWRHSARQSRRRGLNRARKASYDEG
jgi:hypothetical protein